MVYSSEFAVLKVSLQRQMWDFTNAHKLNLYHQENVTSCNTQRKEWCEIIIIDIHYGAISTGGFYGISLN